MKTLFHLSLCLMLLLAVGAASAQEEGTAEKSETPEYPFASVAMKLAGEGVVNDSTILAGKPVTLEFWLTNDQDRRGISLGFEILSDDIPVMVHVPDSGNGVSPNGDIKAFNGFETNQFFDVKGLWINTDKWDGNLPDTVGLAGFNMRTKYPPHESMKAFSFDIIVPTAGSFTVDSAFCKPGITWKIMEWGSKPVGESPDWHGPYRVNVVEDK